MDDNVERECVTSSNDNVERGIDHRKKNTITFKGLDVVRQYAALFERRVQSSTRVRKAQVVTRQTNPIGRSMIEMLGVLAIIAVLSVGGIAGYSKAMHKWKVNKTIDLVTTIYSNTATTFASSRKEDYLENGWSQTRDFVKGNIIPVEYYEEDSYWPHHPLGGYLNVRISPKYGDMNILLQSLSKDDCISLATNNWNGANGVFINSDEAVPGWCSDGLDPYNVIKGDGKGEGDGTLAVCPAINNIQIPISPALATEACAKDSNHLYFSFKF